MKRKLIGLLTSACLAFSASAELVTGGDFQFHKPGSTSITATITGGFVPWPSSITTPIDPDSLTVNGGTADYSDSTSGTKVDLLGWTKSQGGGDLVANGIGDSMALNLFAAWGGFPRPIVETAGSLHTIASGDTITISTMVGGPSTGPKSGTFIFSLYADGVEVTPTSVVDQTLPLDAGFQMISRTYDAAALAPYIGQTAKIRIAVPDSNTIGNRIIFDDVTFTVVPGPASPVHLVITPGATAGQYNFEWNSQAGKVYDLVSATDLSTAPGTWPVWDGRQNLAATPPNNSLTNIPGGGDPRRFFVLIEKDAP